MSTAFVPTARSVIIPVYLFGVREGGNFHFAIDTGATRTCIRPEFLHRLGIDREHPVSEVRIRSATGRGQVPQYRVGRVLALGQLREDFLIAAQELPVGVQADGLLGLDFYRGQILKLDFSRGRASLAAPSWWRIWR